MKKADNHNPIAGFAVHMLTASGAFWAFLALVAAAENRFISMWFWLGVAMIVDGIDGPLARYFEIKKSIPHWSGEMLDSIIDYTTYALIPAFALYQSGFLQEYASFLCAALIVCTSAVYYADTRTKNKDNFFVGFPICWNMLVFTLFVIEPNWYIAMATVIVSAVLTFTPILFVHPVRVVRWRNSTLAIFGLWSVFGLIYIAYKYFGYDVPETIKLVIMLSAIYIYVIGMIMQLLFGGSDGSSKK